MKKIIVFALLIAAALFVIVPRVLVQVQPPVVTPSVTPSVTVTFDTGTTIATHSGVTASTAFQALIAAAEKQSWEVTSKQYDFGVFVQGVGPLANTKEKAWIFFVNGKAGTVAADKQPLNAGDSVEWKYITPAVE